MRRLPLVVLAFTLTFAPANAAGLLIPKEKALPPLAMVDHKVTVAIEDQLAVTRVEQTFRNHTDRQLEATYVFPVPKGATVNKFTMWVDGKETKGEMLPADKARDIYTSIVQRTQDPGLLEYIGNDLLRLRVFPVLPKADQKVAVSFTSVAAKEEKLVEYLYPLKTDGKAVETLEKFAVSVHVKSQHGIINVYSPSHALTLNRVNDKEVKVSFDKEQGALDRDFQLFYSTGKDDVGLTALAHRPLSSEKGFATLLISPRFGLGEKYRIPQDMVFVMDTSGSMRGVKMDQARKAMAYCVNQLKTGDRFAMINFATTVNLYEPKLVDATAERLTNAKKWIEELDSTGGTAINAALEAALALRPASGDRPFTVVFFTDGQPTIGETDPEKIFKNISAKNSSHTRIFTFGVGDDVNAALLDRLAESTRAISAYVRPAENIETKVAGLYGKMTNPVLTNLKLETTGDVKFSEVYPAELPDLFHGGQLEVMARFTGKGASAIKLTGKVGKEAKEFVYEFAFPEKTDDGREFVEQLWARRKVGYLLDQIRINGEKAELKDEVVALAKKYGITTPYTSYLIVPDGVTVPPTRRPGGVPGVGGPLPATAPPALGGFGRGEGGGKPGDTKEPGRVIDLARKGEADRLKAADEVKAYELAEFEKRLKDGKATAGEKKQAAEVLAKHDTLNRARRALEGRDKEGATTGKLGVDFSLQNQYLRYQNRMDRQAVRNVNGRNVTDVGGVWIDDAFTPKTEAVVVKAQSKAYFQLLEARPELKKVFQLGNYLVWVAPSGKALVIDVRDGKESLTDAEIAGLFAAKK